MSTCQAMSTFMEKYQDPLKTMSYFCQLLLVLSKLELLCCVQDENKGLTVW